MHARRRPPQRIIGRFASHLAVEARDNQPMGQAKIRKDLKPRIVKNKMKARVACLADVRPDGRCIILQDMFQKAFEVLLRPRLRGRSRSLCVSKMIVSAQARGSLYPVRDCSPWNISGLRACRRATSTRQSRPATKDRFCCPTEKTAQVGDG